MLSPASNTPKILFTQYRIKDVRRTADRCYTLCCASQSRRSTRGSLHTFLQSALKFERIADYLNTSIDYLVGRIDKSTESVRTEKDVAEFIAMLVDFEGINLTRNFSTGKPMLAFESDAINVFLENRIDIAELKKNASESDIPAKYFNEIFKAKCVNEMYYLRDLSERHLQLKDGSTNAAIRRKRRLSEDNERAVAEMFDTKSDSDT